ncbi:MAG TPA: hypothetical protein VFQ87_06655, partial [Bradyrhizobium sp.]|nr:hypothetical protein [Bradyrhizobium sp.]
LDFDLPGPPPKDEIEAGLNALIKADHPVRMEWVDESVLDTDPGLVRTMSVMPPRGTGRLRLIRIGESGSPVDLQPCGGTHVSRTSEIGPMRIQKIENKEQLAKSRCQRDFRLNVCGFRETPASVSRYDGVAKQTDTDEDNKDPGDVAEGDTIHILAPYSRRTSALAR